MSDNRKAQVRTAVAKHRQKVKRQAEEDKAERARLAAERIKFEAELACVRRDSAARIAELEERLSKALIESHQRAEADLLVVKEQLAAKTRKLELRGRELALCKTQLSCKTDQVTALERLLATISTTPQLLDSPTPVLGKRLREEGSGTQTKVRERDVRDRFAARFGGAKEVQCASGHIDVLLADTIVEIKNYKNWRQALGQVCDYAASETKFAHLKKQIHLFNKTGEPVPEKDGVFSRMHVQMLCGQSGVLVSYE